MYEFIYLFLCFENEFILIKKYDIKNYFFKGILSGIVFYCFNIFIIKV